MAIPLEQVEPAIDEALDKVRAFFRADRCGVLTVSEDEQVVRVLQASYSPGVSHVSSDIDLAQLFPWARQKLLVERIPVVVSRMADLPPEAAVDRASFGHMAAQSNLTVPLHLGHVVTHLMVLHTVAEERHWPTDYTPRLRVLGEVIVSALQRKRAFNDLRTGQERLNRAAAAAGCGLWELDVPNRRFWVTAETRRLYGLDPQEAATWERFLGLLHPDDRDVVAARVDGVLAGDGVFDQRYRIVRDGAVRWIHVTARRGGSTRLEGASVDVTEKVEAEQRASAALEEVNRLRDQLEHENMYLRREVSQSSGGDLIIGRSPAIREALALAEQVAATTSTVLLLGVTGTGKERFASFIHHASPRRDRPMVRVNCSAIPSGLIESELFGREKGAYTGAMSKQIGRFELAHGSTLFLDEVGELPLDVQVKLLRVLQEHTIERLGSSRPIPVNVRIIAATNRDLEQAVLEGHFRSDLFYRLNVFPIVVPPLRDRREDIPALVAALVEEIGAAMGKRFDGVARGSLEVLQRYDWPGNLRELRNVLERAMILSPGPMLRVDVLHMPKLASSSKTGRNSTDCLEDVEREHILHVLGQTDWRVKGPDSASDRLRMQPSTLRSRMKKLGIVRPS